MRSLLKRYLLFVIIFMIGLLLLGNIYLIDRNNTIIKQNKRLQEEAARIKVDVNEIIRNLHFLDMTLRGYALNPVFSYRRDLIKTPIRMQRTYTLLERRLKRQSYPMANYYYMQDTVNRYFATVRKMQLMLETNHREDFIKVLAEDKGYIAWKAYDRFSKNVNAFEDGIARKAEARYNDTLRNSYLLQVLMFFLIIPTLGYTAYFTRRSIKLSEKLRKAEAAENEILENQKLILEDRVLERTAEIQKAKKIIEEQSEAIRGKNDDLLMEVARQTSDLQTTNLELVEHNHRLEQFAFIISHNLRAPITRLVGLSNVLNFAKDEEEKKKIMEMVVRSTRDLDEVIADLNQILRIQKLSTGVYEKIPLDGLIGKMRSILSTELQETNCELVTDFGEIDNITSLPQYVESIFYNLISNAIKYRHPDRPPVIHINARRSGGKLQIDVSDNGIGIDVERNKGHLFNLYKRFHFHVEGKGLGLYLVKTQVTALGGTINVSSKPEEGTVFTILLDN